MCYLLLQYFSFLYIQTLHNDLHIEDVQQRHRSRAEYGLFDSENIMIVNSQNMGFFDSESIIIVNDGGGGYSESIMIVQIFFIATPWLQIFFMDY